LVEPGGKILSLYLPAGGHLSHGWQMPDKKLTLTSKVWDVSFYDLDPVTDLIDYTALEKQARELKPKLIISGGTAYPQEIDHEKMAEIAKSVGAFYLADVAHEAGLIAGGANSSPFPFADVVTMTTHKTLRGPRGAMIFGRLALMGKLNSAVFPGLQGGPHLHTIAGIAIALEKAQLPSFAVYAKQTVANAQAMARVFAEKGMKVVSGGTAKHLILLDLRPQETNGWLAATALEAAGFVVNRNTVPFDTASPFYPSGIRLGTPAVTVRGMKEPEMETIAKHIVKLIESLKGITLPKDPKQRASFITSFKRKLPKWWPIRFAHNECRDLCRRFPLKF
jgi:glycine hydroxymethyltransferase